MEQTREEMYTKGTYFNAQALMESFPTLEDFENEDDYDKCRDCKNFSEDADKAHQEIIKEYLHENGKHNAAERLEDLYNIAKDVQKQIDKLENRYYFN